MLLQPPSNISDAFSYGDVVKHPICPQWGVGYIESASNGRVFVLFSGAGRKILDLHRAKYPLIKLEPSKERKNEEELSYLYPTEPGWIEKMLIGWEKSKLQYLNFSFVEFIPHKMIEKSPNGLFWMYLYYTENRTDPEKYPGLAGTAWYRVHVLSHTQYERGFVNPDTYTYRHTYSKHPYNTVWFKCDILEIIEPKKLSDFTHSEDLVLHSTIRNSIAPIRGITTVNIYKFP